MRNNLVDPPTCGVEYDSNGKRAVKKFAKATEAKSFYAKMQKAKKNPKVVKDSPASNGKPKPAADAKPNKKAAVERDVFGQRASSQGAKLNAAIIASKKPLTAAELCERTGLGAGRISAWVRVKLAKGFIKSTDAGLVVAKGKPAK